MSRPLVEISEGEMWAIAIGAIFVALFVAIGMSETARQRGDAEVRKACVQQGHLPKECGNF